MGRRLLAVVVAVLAAMGLAACNGSSSGSGSGGSTPAATVSTPTDSPFSVSFTGPQLAKPGETVTATLTNTGRLPDKYQFEPDPGQSATITPFTVGLAPGQSAKITIVVNIVPLIIHVQSISAGLGGTETDLSIGANT